MSSNTNIFKFIKRIIVMSLEKAIEYYHKAESTKNPFKKMYYELRCYLSCPPHEMKKEIEFDLLRFRLYMIERSIKGTDDGKSTKILSKLNEAIKIYDKYDSIGGLSYRFDILETLINSALYHGKKSEELLNSLLVELNEYSKHA